MVDERRVRWGANQHWHTQTKLLFHALQRHLWWLFFSTSVRASLETCLVPATKSPAYGASVVSKILADQRANKARSAIHHKVKRPVRHVPCSPVNHPTHFLNLTHKHCQACALGAGVDEGWRVVWSEGARGSWSWIGGRCLRLPVCVGGRGVVFADVAPLFSSGGASVWVRRTTGGL